MVGKIGCPAAWPSLPPSGRKCSERWSDRMLPIPKGFASSGPDWDAQENKLAALREARNTRSSFAVRSAAFSREEHGHRASPEHSPSLRMLGGVQDLPGPASLFGLCTAESGSHLINRFQTLPSTEASVSVCTADTSSLLQLFLDHLGLGQEQPRACRRENLGVLCACLSPLYFF